MAGNSDRSDLESWVLDEYTGEYVLRDPGMDVVGLRDDILIGTREGGLRLTGSCVRRQQSLLDCMLSPTLITCIPLPGL